MAKKSTTRTTSKPTSSATAESAVSSRARSAPARKARAKTTTTNGHGIEGLFGDAGPQRHAEGESSPTSRQMAIYEFIRDKIRSRGYGPTVREIGTAFKIRSPNGVVCHLKAL